jgi:hypothetical protein
MREADATLTERFGSILLKKKLYYAASAIQELATLLD